MSEKSSTRTRRPAAADQFAALGIPTSDWTPAMHLAVKQKWTGLPVTTKVDELRLELAAVTVEPTPSADVLEAQLLADAEAEGLAGSSKDFTELAEKEAARLKRNAGVNAWRKRGVLQAALDARDLKFKAMRAAKNPAPVAVEAAAPVEPSADVEVGS